MAVAKTSYRRQKHARASSASGRHSFFTNRFEKQADLAARKILRGEDNVATMLSSVPSASFRIASSAGRQLPKPVLNELQDGFGADLSGVLVHDSVQVNTVVADHDARAFTSGRNIYFGKGEYQPTREKGKELLYHEVAHVLQQTGKISVGNEFSNKPRSVQHKDVEINREQYIDDSTPGEFHVFLFEFPSTGFGFEDLVSLHFAASATSFKRDIEHIRSVTDGDLTPQNLKAADLDAEVKAGYYDKKSAEVKGFVLDCLKLMKKYDAAVMLLSKNLRLRTAAHSHEFYARFLAKQGKNWIYSFLYEKPFNEVYPWPLVDVYRKLVVPKNRAAFTLKGDRSFRDFVVEQGKQLNSKNSLIDNELFFCTMGEFGEALHRVTKNVEFVQQETNKQTDKTWNQGMLFRSETLKGLLDKELAETPLHMSDMIYLKYIDRYIAIADWGMNIYKLTGQFTMDISVRSKYQDKLKDNKIIQYRGKEILKVMTKLFALNKGGLPSISAYQSQVSIANKALLDIWNSINERMLNLVRKEVPLKDIETSEPVSIDALAYAAMLNLIADYRAYLAQYSAVDDSKLTSGDTRIRHRFNIATRFSKDSEFYAWEEGKKLALEVVQNTQKGQSQYFVAILEDWKLEERPPMTKLLEDTSAQKVITGYGGITTGMLSLLYDVIHLEQLTNQLKKEYDGDKIYLDKSADKLPPITYKSVTTRAIEEVRKLPYPKRIYLGKNDFIIPPHNDKLIAGRKTIDELIDDHPRTVDAYKKHRPSDDWNLVAEENPDSDVKQLFVWFFPPFIDTIWRLRNIKEYNILLYWKKHRENIQSYLEKGKYESLILPEISKLTNQEWTAQLMDKANEPTKDEQAKIDGLLAQGYMEMGEKKKLISEQLIKELRKASTVERWIVTERDIKPLIRSYSPNDHSTFSNPGNAAYKIYELVHSMSPFEDYEAHLCAVVLQLLPSIEGSLKSTRRFTVIMQYLEMLIRSYEVIKDSGKRRTLYEVLTPQERTNTSYIGDAVSKLDSAIGYFRRIQVAAQMEYGIKGIIGNINSKDPDYMPRVADVSYPGAVAAGEEFFYNGHSYRIIQVHENFTYHREYGDWRSVAQSPSILIVEGMPDIKDKTVGERPATLLLTIAKDGIETPIKANDDELLNEISHAVGIQVVAKSLEELAEVLNKGAEGLVEIMQLIPGAGQVVMGMRIATTVIQFVTGPEFEAIRGVLSGDTTDAIEEIKKMLDEVFTVEGFLDFIFFGNATLNKISQFGETKAKSKNAGRVSARVKKSALGKILDVVMGLAHGIAFALRQVEGKVQRPVQAMQAFVLSRPKLAHVLEFAADNIEKIDSIAGDPTFNVKAIASEGLGDFNHMLLATFEKLNHLELPNEIVPVERIAEFIIDFLTNHMGLTIKAVKFALVPMLKKVGVWDRIIGAVATAIKSIKDPNDYWREFVKTSIDGKLQSLANETSDSLISKLNEIIPGGFGTPPKFAKETSSTEEEFEDQESKLNVAMPYIDDRKTGTLRKKVSMPFQQGRKLPTRLREDAEEKLGHDFSHVRYVTGATNVTEKMGAKALTSGSYIFLNADLDVSQPSALHIFYHELGHVLQQAGPRPMGKLHSPNPEKGKPGYGLQVSQKREAEAEDISNAATGYAGNEPTEVHSANSAGIEPAFSDGSLRKLLLKFSAVEEIQELSEKILNDPLKKNLPPAIKGYAMVVWNGLLEAIGKLDKSKLPVYVQSDTSFPQKMVARLKDSFDMKVLEHITSHSVTEKKKRGTKTNPPEMIAEFHAGSFVRYLEGMILVQKGFAFSITLHPAYVKKMETGEPIASASDSIIKDLKLNGLFLAAIGGGTPIWKDAMQSFGADADKYQNKVREILRINGYRTSFESPDGKTITIYQKGQSTLRFTPEFVAYVKIEQASSVLPEQMKDISAQSYLDPDKGPTGGLGQIGLRLGKHYEPNHNQKGSGRESHHTTQFLLFEYFYNKSSNKPFPLLEKDRNDKGIYPGLSVSGSSPAEFLSKSGTKVEIESFDFANRGGQMPAILLARTTHRTGKLHVNNNTVDDENIDKSSPSLIINSWFKNAVNSKDPEYLTNEKDATKFRQYKNRKTEGYVKDVIHYGMQHTYHKMRALMLPRLKIALRGVERDYYNDLVEASGKKDPAFEFSATQADQVYKAAEAFNDKVMKDKGWLTS